MKFMKPKITIKIFFIKKKFINLPQGSNLNYQTYGTGKHIILVLHRLIGGSWLSNEWISIIQVLDEKLNLTHLDIIGCSAGAPYSYATSLYFPNIVKIFISWMEFPQCMKTLYFLIMVNKKNWHIKTLFHNHKVTFVSIM